MEGSQASDDRSAHSARRAKAAGAFRTISEVADDLDVAQHVLRFWESKFPQVRPLKRGGGRRYYRPEDVDLLRRIRSLLYEEGYTIKGAQKLLKGQRRAPASPPAARENGSSHVGQEEEQPAARPSPPLPPLDPRQREALIAIKRDLAELRDRLRKFIT
ncbi:MAG: MerR family transcriptional regulator [Alphaproteobacteria bacterium]